MGGPGPQVPVGLAIGSAYAQDLGNLRACWWDRGEVSSILLSISGIRASCTNRPRAPLLWSPTVEPAGASQLLSCPVGGGGTGCTWVVSPCPWGVGRCPHYQQPPPPHTSLKTTLMSQLSVRSVSDTHVCHSNTIVWFCKLSPARPWLFQTCT